MEDNGISPMLLVFLPEQLLNHFKSIYPEIEEKLRIREGYRFRSLLGFQETGEKVCDIVMNQVQFSSCVLADAYLQKNNITTLINDMKPDALKKTPFFVYTSDKGMYYEGNGNLHMIFKDQEINHEYRVMEGVDGVELMMNGLEEALRFVAENFHR
jgi:hypothetical protein